MWIALRSDSMHSIEEFAEELKKRNIRPSYQRIRVLRYLFEQQDHPTADQIYSDLQAEMPTLSRSTVYNTLSILVEAKMVRVLNIEDTENRYDIITLNHGHFKCEICGEIYNFRIDIDHFKSDELSGFDIKDKNVYFKGVCPSCLSRGGPQKED